PLARLRRAERHRGRRGGARSRAGPELRGSAGPPDQDAAGRRPRDLPHRPGPVQGPGAALSLVRAPDLAAQWNRLAPRVHRAVRRAADPGRAVRRPRRRDRAPSGRWLRRPRPRQRRRFARWGALRLRCRRHAAGCRHGGPRRHRRGRLAVAPGLHAGQRGDPLRLLRLRRRAAALHSCRSAPDRLLFTLVEPRREASNFTDNEQFIADIRSTIDRLRGEFPEVRAGATGTPALSNDEMLTPFRDSTVASALAFVLTLGVLLLVIRRVSETVIMVAVLLV